VENVPGSITNLVPPEALKPNRIAASDSSSSVPPNIAPRFGRPPHLMPDNFWSNLKQFLFERPVKIRGNYRSPLMPTEFGSSLWDNLRDFFSSGPAPKGSVKGPLKVDWGGNFGSFWDRLRDVFSPAKHPPLPPGIQPVKVKDIWSKDENFGWTQAISMGIHVAVIVLLVVPLFVKVLPAKTTANIDATPIDISPYVAKLPAGNNKAGGGGGANDHTLTPVNKGKLPKFKMTQFTPPQVHPVNPNPKLAMDPSLLGPPDLRVPSPNLPNFGDPLASGVSNSLGHGNGTGIGSGTGGGVGPGEGGGTGGGLFRAGVNGVGMPTCFYAPDPQYSDEARKAKYQGIVVLQGVITLDGRVTNISVLKSPGLGLDEKAVEAVRQWRCKPAMGPNGKPVPTLVPIEVTFRLF
jgi:TonB family protein